MNKLIYGVLFLLLCACPKGDVDKVHEDEDVGALRGSLESFSKQIDKEIAKIDGASQIVKDDYARLSASGFDLDKKTFAGKDLLKDSIEPEISKRFIESRDLVDKISGAIDLKPVDVAFLESENLLTQAKTLANEKLENDEIDKLVKALEEKIFHAKVTKEKIEQIKDVCTKTGQFIATYIDQVQKDIGGLSLTAESNRLKDLEIRIDKAVSLKDIETVYLSDKVEMNAKSVPANGIEPLIEEVEALLGKNILARVARPAPSRPAPKVSGGTKVAGSTPPAPIGVPTPKPEEKNIKYSALIRKEFIDHMLGYVKLSGDSNEAPHLTEAAKHIDKVLEGVSGATLPALKVYENISKRAALNGLQSKKQAAIDLLDTKVLNGLNIDGAVKAAAKVRDDVLTDTPEKVEASFDVLKPFVDDDKVNEFRQAVKTKESAKPVAQIAAIKIAVEPYSFTQIYKPIRDAVDEEAFFVAFNGLKAQLEPNLESELQKRIGIIVNPRVTSLKNAIKITTDRIDKIIADKMTSPTAQSKNQSVYDGICNELMAIFGTEIVKKTNWKKSPSESDPNAFKAGLNDLARYVEARKKINPNPEILQLQKRAALNDSEKSIVEVEIKKLELNEVKTQFEVLEVLADLNALFDGAKEISVAAVADEYTKDGLKTAVETFLKDDHTVRKEKINYSKSFDDLLVAINEINNYDELVGLDVSYIGKLLTDAKFKSVESVKKAQIESLFGELKLAAKTSLAPLENALKGVRVPKTGRNADGSDYLSIDVPALAVFLKSPFKSDFEMAAANAAALTLTPKNNADEILAKIKLDRAFIALETLANLDSKTQAVIKKSPADNSSMEEIYATLLPEKLNKLIFGAVATGSKLAVLDKYTELKDMVRKTIVELDKAAKLAPEKLKTEESTGLIDRAFDLLFGYPLNKLFEIDFDKDSVESSVASWKNIKIQNKLKELYRSFRKEDVDRFSGYLSAVGEYEIDGVKITKTPRDKIVKMKDLRNRLRYLIDNKNQSNIKSKYYFVFNELEGLNGFLEMFLR